MYITNQFAQDEISLVPDRLEFILGCKLEQNSFTNFQYQPTARLLWTPDRKQTFWGAVSRAVRTPAFTEEYLFSTSPPVGGVFPRIIGDEGLQSETLMAYEIGYRAGDGTVFLGSGDLLQRVWQSNRQRRRPATNTRD